MDSGDDDAPVLEAPTDADVPAEPGADEDRRSRILAIANQKGGVGKTTTAVNLGTALGAIGKSVLLIDLDSQGNASTGLGIDRADRTPSIYQALIGESSLGQVIRETQVPNLYIAPSCPELAGAEIELIHTDRRSYRLKESIDHFCNVQKAAGLDEHLFFDFILIDCPPSLNLLTVNALAAADGVLVPLQCEFFALEGLSQLLQTINRVKGSVNPNLEIQGIVLTMFDKRNNLSGQVADDVREHLGEKVYNTVIPRNVRISEAPSFGRPALLYDYKCSGSQAYIKLAVELIQRERLMAGV